MGKQNIYKSAMLIVVSEFLFVSMGTMVKFIPNVPNETRAFFANFFLMLILCPFIKYHHLIQMIQKFWLHLLRSTAGLGAIYCLFHAYANMPIAKVSLIKMTIPFFLPFTDLLLNKKGIQTHIILSILIGFIGVLVILKIETSLTFSSTIVIALLGALLMSLAKSTIHRIHNVKSINDNTSSVEIGFFFGSFGTLFSILPMYLVWVTLTWQAFFLLSVIGICYAVGQLLMTMAFDKIQTAKIGSFGYASVIFGGLSDYFFLNETIGLNFFCGATLIFIALIFIFKK